jgi:MOSC domain-containing protein YiiM
MLSEDQVMLKVEQLFISPGHNFFGHHGQQPGEHPNVAVEEIECVAGRGIRGDRFYDYEVNYQGQITFFSVEVFEALRRDLSLPEAKPAATRRNVFVSGAELNSLIGKQFEIQGVRFEGIEQCRPCYWMNRALGDERAEQCLQGRGGLRARILSSGVVKRDSVS